MISRQILIHGHVQGVFFRQSAQKKALELGVSGLVRNLKDGSVEVIAEGSSEKIKLLIEWCHSGPTRARVDKVDIHECPLKNYTGFIISY